MVFNNFIASGPGSTTGTITNPTFGVSGTIGGGLMDLLAMPNPAAFFEVLLPNVVSLCFIIATVIFLFMIITGAIQWISSGGDKQGLESARGKVSNALIGIVILFATFAVMKLIETFFGIKILTIDIGPLIIR